MRYVIGGIAIMVIVAIILLGKVKPATSEEAAIPSQEETALSVSQEPETSIRADQAETQNTVTHKRVKNGMTIETLQSGNGAEITTGQTAVVEYTGMLTDGTVFDASARHGQPFSFPLGAGVVIKGWDEGVVGMKVGEKRELTIPPELGYGPNGYPGVIPPNATLIFEVTLVGIK